MQKEILRKEMTNNLRLLKKYVDKAIELGAERIEFNHQLEEFVFKTDYTLEEENQIRLKELTEKYNKEKEYLESLRLKTHILRINFGMRGIDENNLINSFKTEKNIQKIYNETKKRVINDDYDDYEDNKITVFITEQLNK